MKLSSYVLTHNSQLYIEEILLQLSKCSDEIIVVDSGSTDATKSIVEKFGMARFVYNKFENFKSQRSFAVSQCSSDLVFFVDSDEIPTNELIESIKNVALQNSELATTAYGVKRQWYVMNCKVHSIYPVTCPDYPVRLFDKKYVSFDNANFVHETISGYTNKLILAGDLQHHTFHTCDELYRKLDQYTTLAAIDLQHQHKKRLRLRIILDPIFAFFKWYIYKKGFLDGKVGLQLGLYAMRYTKLKYKKCIDHASSSH